MNLPTKITVARIALIPLMLIVYCLKSVFQYYYVVNAFIFLFASVTDFADGYIARKYNMVTDLGKFLDPIADKILVVTGFVFIIADATINIYLAVIGTVIILTREFAIGVFRQLAASKGSVLAADKLGKLKTIFTIIGVNSLLISPIRFIDGTAWRVIGDIFFYAGYAAFCIAVVLTVWSGVNYVIKNKHVLSDKGRNNE